MIEGAKDGIWAYMTSRAIDEGVELIEGETIQPAAKDKEAERRKRLARRARALGVGVDGVQRFLILDGAVLLGQIHALRRPSAVPETAVDEGEPDVLGFGAVREGAGDELAGDEGGDGERVFGSEEAEYVGDDVWREAGKVLGCLCFASLGVSLRRAWDD